MNKQTFMELYIDQEFSTVQIGNRLGMSPGTVLRNLRRHGIAVRTKAQAMALAARKGRVGNKHLPRLNGSHGSKGAKIWMCYLPDHPRANHQGHVKEHIFIWEQETGLCLPSGWVVHHLNGDSLDNRFENLMALSNSQHSRFHADARRAYGSGRQSCPGWFLARYMKEWSHGVSGHSGLQEVEEAFQEGVSEAGGDK